MDVDTSLDKRHVSDLVERTSPPKMSYASLFRRFLAPGQRGTALMRLSRLRDYHRSLLMLLIFAALQPDTFATVGNFRNILNDMAIGAIIAAGLTIPLVAGDFDLSIGYVSSSPACWSLAS